MTGYRAPLRDMRFVLHELLEVERRAELPGYEDATRRPDRRGARGGREVLRERAVPAQPLRRRGGLRLRERRGAHARGLQGGLRAGSSRAAGPGSPPIRRRAARACPRRSSSPSTRWSAPPTSPSHLPGPERGRLPRDRGPCRPTAEGDLPAEARRRVVVGHHVPDRAAMRHRPRPDPHQAEPTATAPTDHRHQDLHQRRRARPDREHRPSGARAAARRPSGTRGISLFLVPKFLPKDDGCAGAAQRRQLRRHRAQDGHQRPRPPAS